MMMAWPQFTHTSSRGFTGLAHSILLPSLNKLEECIKDSSGDRP